MGEFEFKGFRKKDLAKMCKTFNKAFSDYLIPIQLSQGQFTQKIIQKTNISFKYSVGTYYNKKLVGFIFNSINYYESKKTAYNGGTGVIANFRGQNLTEKMYEFVLPDLQTNGVEQCILEVISNNQPAIKAYENIGFRRTKYYHCMKLTDKSPYLVKMANRDIQIKVTDRPKWKKYSKFCDYNTCFLDSFPMLKNNKQNETFLEAYSGNMLVGFLIFNRKMGRVAHIGVDHNERGKGIGTLMIKNMIKICRDNPIYILNLNERYYDLLNFFLRLGFQNEIDQFEFKLSI